MAKYSESFKVMVVQEYLSGPLGIELLARKHGVKSHRQVLYWVNAFKQFGATGLSRKKKNEVYTIQFKLDGGTAYGIISVSHQRGLFFKNRITVSSGTPRMVVNETINSIQAVYQKL